MTLNLKEVKSNVSKANAGRVFFSRKPVVQGKKVKAQMIVVGLFL